MAWKVRKETLEESQPSKRKSTKRKDAQTPESEVPIDSATEGAIQDTFSDLVFDDNPPDFSLGAETTPEKANDEINPPFKPEDLDYGFTESYSDFALLEDEQSSPQPISMVTAEPISLGAEEPFALGNVPPADFVTEDPEPIVLGSEASAMESETEEEGAFTPYEPAASDFSIAPDRDEIAPNLAFTESDTDLPRVAPFVVDVSPAPVENGPLGLLTLRIGNFSSGFTITKDFTVVGRPDTATKTYPDVEIELDDAVSRKHLEIRRHTGEFYVVDTNSTNGAMLNGQKLEPMHEYRLNPGDSIRLGDRTEILFE